MHNLNFCQLCFTCTSVNKCLFKYTPTCFYDFPWTIHKLFLSFLNIGNTILTLVKSVSLEQTVFWGCCRDTYCWSFCRDAKPRSPALYQLGIILPLGRRAVIFHITWAHISSSRFAMLVVWSQWFLARNRGISTIAVFVHILNHERYEHLTKHLVCSDLGELGSATHLCLLSAMFHLAEPHGVEAEPVCLKGGSTLWSGELCIFKYLRWTLYSKKLPDSIFLFCLYVQGFQM